MRQAFDIEKKPTVNIFKANGLYFHCLLQYGNLTEQFVKDVTYKNLILSEIFFITLNPQSLIPELEAYGPGNPLVASVGPSIPVKHL